MDHQVAQGMLSVVIPAYNEPAVAEVVREAQGELDKLDRPYEIIVIDDGSTSGSIAEIQPSDKVTVHRRRTNRGYGASLKEGIRLARGEILLTMDADGQHRPADIEKILKPMDEGADAALGSRQKLIHSSLWRMPGKWLLHRLATYLVRRKIHDLNCGFRAFRTEIIRRHMHLCPNGYSFSMTTTLILASERYDVAFVPLDVEPRVGKSSLRVSDGLATLMNVVRIIMLFNPLRVFFPPTAFCLTLGTVSLIFDIVHVDITQGTILLLVSGMLFFFFGLLADQVSAIRKEIS